mgnify:CR=1 FL=1
MNPLTAGFGRFVHTLRAIRRHRQVFLFLLAFWFYNDGIGSIIKMAAIFATEIGLSTQEVRDRRSAPARRGIGGQVGNARQRDRAVDRDRVAAAERIPFVERRAAPQPQSEVASRRVSDRRDAIHIAYRNSTGKLVKRDVNG